MALKALRPCKHPGCPNLTRDVWCDKHKPPPPQRSEAAEKWHRWYGLPIWRDRLRPEQLLREPFCRECARRGIRTYATDVDHIRPHRGDWALFTDPCNLQSLCHACHSAKTMREMGDRIARNRS